MTQLEGLDTSDRTSSDQMHCEKMMKLLFFEVISRHDPMVALMGIEIDLLSQLCCSNIWGDGRSLPGVENITTN